MQLKMGEYRQPTIKEAGYILPSSGENCTIPLFPSISNWWDIMDGVSCIFRYSSTLG